MKNLLLLAAVGEVATGLVLVVYPPIVVRLLIGAEIAGAGVVISRIAGIALLALGIACWPSLTALCGMLTYNALATVYLAYIAVRGEWAGPLLWPAVVLHMMLTALLARSWFKAQFVAQPNTHAKNL